MLLTFLRNEWNLKQSVYEDDDDVIFVAVDLNHYKKLGKVWRRMGAQVTLMSSMYINWNLVVVIDTEETPSV